MLNQLMDTKGFIYIIFAFLMVSAALIIIPKNLYKKFFLYGLLFGGLVDIVILFAGTFAGLFRYTGLDPFGIFGLFSIWTPITWTFAFMLFFYFQPIRKGFLVFYIIAWAGLNYSVGIILENIGLFHYYGIQNYIAPVIFLVWYSVSAYVFRKYEQHIHI